MNDLLGTYKVQCKCLKMNGLTNLELNNYNNFKDVFSKYEFELILREKQNRKNKRNRTKKRFIDILKLHYSLKGSKLVFGTITINNEYLSKTEQTRIKIIEKWLKSHFYIAILNKDFGDKTEREHYHFVGITLEEVEEVKGKKSKKGYQIYELAIKDYKIGFEPDLCIIDLKANDIDKTINYLLKLNNHSSKTTTKNRVRIIKSDMYKFFIDGPKKQHEFYKKRVLCFE